MKWLRRPFVLPLAFFTLGLVTILHHEMWRDELEAWDIARTSGSIAELRAGTRYVGQPPLWPLALYAVTRVTSDPRAMQALNLAFVTAAIAVLSAWAPFGTWQKWLFAFGYFPFFEYGMISRPYGLGLLLLTGACASLSGDRRRPLRVAAWFSLLALCHFHATLIVIAALAAGVGLSVLGRRRPSAGEAAGFALVVAAVGLAVALAIPPPGSSYLHPFRLDLDAERTIETLSHLWRGYVPFPVPIDSFWNHNLLDRWPLVEAAGGLAIAAAFAWGLRRRMAAALMFFSGTSALLLFSYMQLMGQTRHDGQLFLILVMASWLAVARGIDMPRWAQRLFSSLLAVNTAAGAFAAFQDLRLPFSQSGAVAEALRAPEFADLPIVGDVDFAAAAVAARLQRPIYLASQGRFGTHVEWSNERSRAGRSEVRKIAGRLVHERHSHVVLLLDYVLDPLGRVEPLGCFEGAIVANETYCLYRIGPVADVARDAP
jgi:hypothetical protein